MNQNNCTYLAIASVPMQTWHETYRPETAFVNGTIFPELDLPYTKVNGAAAATKTARCQTCARGCSK